MGPYDNPEVPGELSKGWTLTNEKHNIEGEQANKVPLLYLSCILLQGVVLPYNPLEDPRTKEASL